MGNKLLWVGDAVVPTGFAKVTHSVLEVLHDVGWDIDVMGINYHGDPHGYDYRIFPACRAVDQDMFGFGRLEQIIHISKPDVVCIIQDPWHLYNYIRVVRESESEEVRNTPLVAYIPVDAENIRYEWASTLNQLNRAIFYTNFGLEVCKSCGFNGDSAVIPHGVDLDVFKPEDRHNSREVLGIGKQLPKDAFIFGNVNQNQVRKRLDITVRAFYTWLAKSKVRNAWLYIHAKSRGVVDLNQLATYYERVLRIKPKGRLITLGDNMTNQGGVAEKYMRYVYSCFDVQVNTCGGEGWGLAQIEGMACKVAEIAPDFGSLAEWTKGSAHLVPCNNTLTWEFNTIGHMPSEELLVDAFDKMYSDENYRNRKAQEGYNLVQRPFFRWKAIGRRFSNVLSEVVNKAQEKAKEDARQVENRVGESSGEDESPEAGTK